MARAYEESQSFVSLLAHELRSKLRVTERALTDEQVGCEIALENTRTLQELVETLLELARGTIGGSSDAGEVMQDVLDDLARRGGRAPGRDPCLGSPCRRATPRAC